jgi:hypothetical protein
MDHTGQEPAVVFGKSFSMRATASSAGSTPPRVIERQRFARFNSAGDCCKGRQLAIRKQWRQRDKNCAETHEHEGETMFAKSES